MARAFGLLRLGLLPVLAGLVLAGCPLSGLNPAQMLSGDGHLPEGAEIAGWQQTGDLERFGGKDLEDYIGRQAALYRNYGFVVLCVADYRRPGAEHPALTIESYEMERPMAASAVFHYHRGRKLPYLEGSAAPVDVGVNGAGTERVLYFYKDRWFFKLIYSGAAGQEPDLPAIGRHIAAAIPGEARPPRGFEYLAVEGVDAKTAEPTAGYTFNYAFLPPAIRAEAPGAGPIAEVYLIGHFERDQAEKTAQDHRYWLRSNGLDYSVKRTGSGRLLWMGRDPSQGRVICTQYRTWVILVLAPKTYERGEVMLDRIVERISGR
jgi:hypothetical protein